LGVNAASRARRSVLERLSAVVELTRPLNSAMTALAVIVSLAMATGGSFSPLTPLELLAVYAAGFAATSVVMIVNDVVDAEIDAVNAPHRPIPSGRITREEALRAAALISLLGAAAALVEGWLTAAAYAFVISAGILYNVWGKKTGLPGNIIVAGLTASPFIYAGLLTGGITPLIATVTLMVFLSVLAREIVKGVADVEGDSRAGVKTLAVTLGPRAAARIAALLYLAAIAVSPLPLLVGEGISRVIYASSVAVLDALMLREIAILWRGVTREEALRHKNRVLLYMLVALLGILAASLAPSLGLP